MALKINFKIKNLTCTVIALFLLAVSGSAEKVQAQENIRWHSMQQAQKLAKKQDKKVLIYAEASWCMYCEEMNKEVFPQPQVIDSLNSYFYPVKIDIESEEKIVFNGEKMTQKQFALNHRVRATPTIFFLNSSGKILGAQPGFIPVDTFSRLLGFVGSDSYQKMEFGSYLKQHTKGASKQAEN